MKTVELSPRPEDLISLYNDRVDRVAGQEKRIADTRSQLGDAQANADDAASKYQSVRYRGSQAVVQLASNRLDARNRVARSLGNSLDRGHELLSTLRSDQNSVSNTIERAYLANPEGYHQEALANAQAAGIEIDFQGEVAQNVHVQRK